MLDWCRNQQPQRESGNEMTLIAGNQQPQPQSQSSRNLDQPKFANTSNQTRHPRLDNKKGIKVHCTRSVKVDQESQTVNDPPHKQAKDCFTQTETIAIHPLNSRRNSLATSRQPSPIKSNIFLSKPEPCKSELINTLEASKTIDYKNERNRETKASFNLLQSQDKAFKYDDQFFRNFRGVESYHLPESKTFQEVQPFYPQTAREIMRSKLPHKDYQISQRMLQSIRHTINEQHEENTNSQKYRTMLRNVESEFKLSGQKLSQRRLRYTPEKRVLFHQRQTIISKYGEQSHDEQRSLRVEESLVYDRETRSSFISIGKLQAFETFLIFLAMQKTIHMMVSIKQISVKHMNHISEELLIYREMEEKRVKIQGILELYQTQIDRDSYLFIKQPYTESLRKYIQQTNDLNEVYRQIGAILQEMSDKGFTLRTYPRLQDFVVCYNWIKLQNPGIFDCESHEGIPIQSAIQFLKEQFLQHLL